MDEIDKLSARKMALLKNLMQMAGVNLRKAYQKNYRQLPRIASFIATSNHKEILTDPTGSRRFLCIEVERKIDCSPIDYRQLYAQLKTQLTAGEPYWFTTDDEARIMAHNTAFQKRGMIEDIFNRYYRTPEANEPADLRLAADLFEHLKKRHPAPMRNATPNTFGKTLMALGIERVHRKDGNYYKVVCKRE